MMSPKRIRKIIDEKSVTLGNESSSCPEYQSLTKRNENTNFKKLLMIYIYSLAGFRIDS
jgi:hypothetical protein